MQRAPFSVSNFGAPLVSTRLRRRISAAILCSGLLFCVSNHQRKRGGEDRARHRFRLLGLSATSNSTIIIGAKEASRVTIPTVPAYPTLGNPGKAKFLGEKKEDGMLPRPEAVRRMDLTNFRKNMDSVGYCVVEDAFNPEWCKLAVSDLTRLQKKGILAPEKVQVRGLLPNSTLLAPCVRLMTGKLKGIDSLDLMRNSTSLDLRLSYKTNAPALAMLSDPTELNPLLLALNHKFPELRLTGLDGIRIRYIHPGESCGQELQYDCVEEFERAVGLYICLSEDWKTINDGSLLVHPFPFKSKEIKPKFNRVVFVDSRNVPTRIMPSSANPPGWWITLWFKGGRPKPPQDLPIPRPLQPRLTFLKDMKSRLFSARFILQEEFEETLREAVIFENKRAYDEAARFYQQAAMKAERYFPQTLLTTLKRHLPLNDFPGSSLGY
mmetsp:Transcript_25595/g.61682  ORF Transcript_25595/g.61682 Transcript_25595/m.61682 type:complete len:437 (-) Transcript_25595:107-1417(-)